LAAADGLPDAGAAATKTPWRRIATAAAAAYVATLRLRVRDLARTAPYGGIRTVTTCDKYMYFSKKTD
jgi:hypothetical protein